MFRQLFTNTTALARLEDSGWVILGTPENHVQLTRVLATAVFDDDGDGPRPPRLYLGGENRGSGSSETCLATWDGTHLVRIDFELRSGTSGGRPRINSLTAFDDDGEGPLPPALYVGGDFRSVGGNESYFLARYGRSEVPMDLNRDSRIDLADFPALVDCMNDFVSDPAIHCCTLDANYSGTIDLRDFATFQNRFAPGD